MTTILIFCIFDTKGEIPEIRIDEEKYKKKLQAILKPFENIFDCLDGKAAMLRSLMNGEYFEPKAMSDSNAQRVTNDINNKLSSFGDLITSTQTNLAKFDFNSNLRSARRKRDLAVPKVIEDVDEYLRSLMTVEGLITYLVEHTDLEIETIDGISYVRICVNTDLGCIEFLIKSEIIAKILEILKSVDPCLKEILKAIATAKRALVELKNTIVNEILGFLKDLIKDGVILVRDGIIYVGGKPIKFIIDKGCQIVETGWHCVTGLFDDIKNYISSEPKSPSNVPINKGDFSYNCPCQSTTPEPTTTTLEPTTTSPEPTITSSEPTGDGPIGDGPTGDDDINITTTTSEPSTPSGYRWKCA